MKKNYLFLIFISALMVLSFHGFSLAEPALSDAEVFEGRLTQVLALSIDPNVSAESMGRATEGLIRFYAEYPNSEFASDAQVVPIIFLSAGAFSKGEKEKSAAFINKMELIANKYPSGKLSDFTCKKIREVLGEGSSGVIFIPYKYLPVYLRGNMGIYFRDLQGLIDNFLLLKENLNFNKDESGVLANDIYAPLLMAYKSLGKMKELEAAIKEAKQKFPDNKLLMQTIDTASGKSGFAQ